MKVIHVPFCFYPDPVGGTEVYVASLAKEQKLRGVDAVVAAPGQREEVYWHGDIRVWRIPVNEQVDDLRELYGEGDRDAARCFGRVLDAERPDLVHLHAFTRGVSLRTVREAKRRNMPVVFSYHTPTASCQRGTLMRWGSEICDGVLDTRKCSACALHGHGLNRITSQFAGTIPAGAGRVLGRAGLSGGMWTALRMTELVEVRQAAFRSLVAEVDHVVALCQWAKDLLVRNGVPERKITVSRQGIAYEPVTVRHNRNKETGERPNDPIRIAFLGRLDPTKGVHLLIQALNNDRKLPVRLDLYGVAQGEGGATYLEYLKDLSAGDSRIHFLDPISADDVVARLREYDALAVPSQWLETGPMVVLEAFAAGIPVIGSNLGGIAELVTHGADGMLVEAPSRREWVEALRMLCENRESIARLKLRVRPPRMIDDVAADMQSIYSVLVQRTAAFV
jgi:glycosyltransferase involved in cell wall biosynthesis